MQDLENTTNYLKLFLSNKMKFKNPKVLYGGSVNTKNISILKKITNLDGFLIGGASQNSDKFIDIIKKTFNSHGKYSISNKYSSSRIIGNNSFITKI